MVSTTNICTKTHSIYQTGRVSTWLDDSTIFENLHAFSFRKLDSPQHKFDQHPSNSIDKQNLAQHQLKQFQRL